MLSSGPLSPSRLEINSEEKEAYFREWERALLIISMCRPFIREPGLINRWKSGDRRKGYMFVG